MKKILIVALVFIGSKLMAQSRVGTVEYDRQQVASYIIDLPYSTEIVKEAINNRFKNMGVKGKDKKGFLEYRNVIIPEISSSPIDALIKVERPNRREKNASVVYMIVNPAGEPAIAGRSTDTYSSGSHNFLNGLTVQTQDHSLELDIKNQEDEVKKAEKKFNNLVDDGNDMVKKLKRLQEDIEENKKNQALQTSEIQKQRDALVLMQSRRRKQG